MDDVPKIKNMLNMLLPITFPNAMSVSPLRAATMDVTNSGKDVPAATIVKAMVD